MTTRPASDLYDDLGVPPDATPTEIKAAGRKAAKAHHPDRGGDPEKFDASQKALKVLLDPDRRAHYDRTGDTRAGNPEELEKAEATSALAQYMNMVMEGGEPRFTHLPKLMRQKIVESISAHKNKLAQVLADKDHKVVILDAYAKRLKKKDGTDILRAMLDGQRADVLRAAASQEEAFGRAIRINERALAMLEGYEYEEDAAPTPNPAAGILERLIQEEFRRQNFFTR